MQHRQPGHATGIEPPGGDLPQHAARGLVTILAIDIEQQCHSRFLCVMPDRRREPAEQIGKCGAHDGQAPAAETRRCCQPAVVRGGLERLQRVEVQGLLDPVRQSRPDAWHRAEQRLGLSGRFQPLEKAPAPGCEHLHDGGGNRRSNSRHGIQSGLPAGLHDVTQVRLQAVDCISRMTIG